MSLDKDKVYIQLNRIWDIVDNYLPELKKAVEGIANRY
jgi:uncharacterized protein with HEPN domain